ncbi:NADH-quinone oxidoreductase subunit NuoE [Thermosediminibacter litoriperuensis]|uniref:NADH-quinone oxidoreductase subunit E n=1 Tax=Thermosediminibacter litoriperuensis TaxID=291989 RepID=A0A5S5AE99_9FIRM|nr:NADH-quinone oxidoreductase subunit NuoE [Thermosediminibacter litoriperuensis]TYP47446.1 NADH-quinone oxidoreductase subunit E [Thermosediminibacter litoriperuensis]
MIQEKRGEDLSQVKSILDRYPRERRFLLAILQDIQKTYNYLPREALNEVRDYLGIPLSSLYSMATFYKALSLKPKGTYVIKVCDGTACHIRGSMDLIDEIRKLLSVSPGEVTKDGRFSLETVNCVGSCALAPVMVINDKYYGNLKPAMVKEILAGYGGIRGDWDTK